MTIGQISLPTGPGVNTPASVSAAISAALNGNLSAVATASRSLASRFQDRATVFDYPGVTGNGSADDTAGLQAAINDCAGKRELLFPMGYNFYQTAALTIPANSVIRLYGTIKKSAFVTGQTQYSQFLLTGSSILFDMGSTGVIDGNLENQGGAQSTASAGIVTWYGSFQYSPTGSQTLFDKIRITGGTIQNTYNWPVSIAAQNSVVDNLTMDTANSSPQFICSMNSGFFSCCVGNINDDGLGLYQGNVRCWVRGCTVYNSLTGPFILTDGNGTANLNCDLTGNIAFNCTDAGVLVSGVDNPNVIQVGHKVQNNLIVNCGFGGAGGISVGEISNTIISGNLIFGNEYTDIGVQLFGQLNDVKLIGNQLKLVISTAIIVRNDPSAGNTSVEITDNKLSDSGTGYCAGIVLGCTGSSSYISVSRNTFDASYGENGSVAFADQSSTPAALFEGTDGPMSATSTYQMPQNLMSTGLITANQGFLVPPNVITPTSNSTVTLTPSTSETVLNLTSGLASLTIALPYPWALGAKIKVSTSQAVAALTVSSNYSVQGAPSSMAAATSFTLQWVGDEWLRIDKSA